jgi:hypothetical protein
MECHHAELLMHEALDVGDAPTPALSAHLADCARCAGRFARLQSVEGALRAAVGAPVPEERLHDAVERARALATARRPRPTPRLAWAGAALTLGLCAFGSGAWFGRSAWPREVTVVRTEVRPEIVERVVEKRVEVRVPVVQYRDRVVVRTVRVAAPARPEARGRSTDLALTSGTSPRVTPAFQFPSLPPAVISQELVPARIATPPPPTDKPTGASLLDPAAHHEVALACASANAAR